MRLLLLTLALLAAPAIAHADCIVVFPPSATNVTPPEAMAAGTLLADALRDTTGARIVGPQGVQPPTGSASPEAVAQSQGCAWYVESSIVRLDRTGQMSADLVNVTTNERRHRQIPLGSLDDMAPASTRLASALWNNEQTARNQTIDTVTDRDAEQIKRQQTDTFGGIRIGMLANLAKGYQFNPGFEIMFDKRIEQRYWFFSVAFGALFGTGGDNKSLKYGLLELGAAYYLTGGDLAPYLGLGLSPRVGGIDKFGFGLAPYAMLGLTLGRTSTARFTVEARASQNVLGQKIELSHPAGAPTVYDNVYPTEVGGFVGVWW